MEDKILYMHSTTDYTFRWLRKFDQSKGFMSLAPINPTCKHNVEAMPGVSFEPQTRIEFMERFD